MTEADRHAESVRLVDEFVAKLRDLMWAVAVNSDTYGTYHEESELRKFLLDSGLFGGTHNDGAGSAT